MSISELDLAAHNARHLTSATKREMEETAPEARTRAELRGRRLSWISELLAIPRFDETVQSNYHPWYMVGMFHFRRAPRLADIRSDTFPRIARFPRFAMVLREGERNEYVTEPVDPASMDATYHVRALQQERPWTQDDLNDYVGSLGDSLQLENSRPLWQLRLVERLEGGGAVLICVLDHTIGDGAYAMTALLSATDAVDGLPAVRKQTMTAPPRRRMQRKLGAAEWLGVQGTGLATVFAPGLVSDGPSPLKPPFNLPPSARKHVSTSRPIALDAVRTLRQAVRLPGLPERAGSLTVHDVIVAATAVALHECIADAGVERYTPRIGYTFSLRPPGFDALSDARGSVTLGHKCALPSAAVARGPAAGVLRHMKLEHDRSKQSIDGFLFDGLGERMFPAMKGLRMHSTMLHLLHQECAPPCAALGARRSWCCARAQSCCPGHPLPPTAVRGRQSSPPARTRQGRRAA